MKNEQHGSLYWKIKKSGVKYVVLVSIFVVYSSLGSFHGSVVQAQQAQLASLNGLVSMWGMDEGKGLTAADSLGQSNGTIANGTVWDRGKIGSSLRFDGKDDVVKVTSASTVNSLRSFTLCAWIFPTQYGGIIFRKGQGSEAYFNVFTVAQSGLGDNSGVLGVRAGFSQQAGAWRTLRTITLNQWHHIAISYTPGNRAAVPSMFIDGAREVVTQKYAPLGEGLTDDSSAFIGNNHTSTSGFKGNIDEVRLYNRVLTDKEVLDLFRQAEGTTSKQKPNIVVIMTDDQDDQKTLDVMTKVKSQLIDRGVRFINSYVANPLCCTSRATFLTGQYNHNNGVWSNTQESRDGRTGGYATFAPTESNALPVWLQQAGYQTALIGKYLNGYGLSGSPSVIPAGWDTWNGLVDPTTYAYYNYTINENGTLRSFGAAEADYQTDVLSGKAVDYIKTHAGSGRPFFLWLTPMSPHFGSPGVNGPEPAPRHKGMYATLPVPKKPSYNESDISDKPTFMKNNLLPLTNDMIQVTEQSYRQKREALLSVDDMVSNVVDALQATGVLDNTYIIFTSDNGFFYGEHRLPADKKLIYEEAIRVPLVLRGPTIPIGQTREQLVSNVDLTSTILEWAGASANRVQDGRSIMPWVRDAQAFGRSVLMEEGLEMLPYDARFFGFYSGVHTKRYVYVEHHQSGMGAVEKEFYDLSADPYQLKNSVDNPIYQAIVSSLQETLKTMERCSGAACWIDADTPVAGTFKTFRSSVIPTALAASMGWLALDSNPSSGASSTGNWAIPSSEIGEPISPVPGATPDVSYPPDVEESSLSVEERQPIIVTNYGRLGLLGETASAAAYENPLTSSDLVVLLTQLLSWTQGFVVVLALVFLIIGALLYLTSGGSEKQITWAKAAILAAMIGLALVIAAPLFLREIGIILGWVPSNLPNFGTSLTFTQVLGKVLSFLLGIIGVVSIIMLVIGGFTYLTSAGDTNRADTGKSIVTYAIVGIAVALAALVIIRQLASFFV